MGKRGGKIGEAGEKGENRTNIIFIIIFQIFRIFTTLIQLQIWFAPMKIPPPPYLIDDNAALGKF